MKISFDSWDTGFRRGSEVPETRSREQVETDVEVPAAAWRPLRPDDRVRPAPVVRFVDGVLRHDAELSVEDDNGVVHPALAASCAAGVLRCDHRTQTAELVDRPAIERGLFTPAAGVPDLGVPPARYEHFQVKTSDPGKIQHWVTDQLAALEARVCEGHRDDDDLLVLDGPLRGRRHLPRTVGYIKTHSLEYLDAAGSAVIRQLSPGSRTPIFRLGEDRFSWYLRLPSGDGPLNPAAARGAVQPDPMGRGVAGSPDPMGSRGVAGSPEFMGSRGVAGSPWAGITRVECSGLLGVADAIALADIATATLPRYAAKSYKDPRAPQNLTPIGGLERLLRAKLGHPQILRRELRRAAAGA